MLSTPTRLLRTFLALLAVVALVGACGGDDSGKKDDAPSKSKDSTATTKADDGDDTSKEGAIVDDPCSLLDKGDLSDVTGITFNKEEPGVDSCTYTSAEGAAAIALHFADLKGADPKDAIDAGKTSCDAGTVQDLDFSDADGGFGCLVNGVPTVAAVGNGVFAVLTGATLDSSVDTDQILQDLATILENAISS